MNYWDGQKWTPSNPSFEATDDGFVANRAQHKVHLASNLNVAGAVKITTRDGVTLNSTPAGIGLFDAASGNFLLIATVTNSIGVLADSNKVVYPNAFSGVCANVMYTMRRGSFHQDVVLTGQVDPAAYGFPPQTTRIQILTEFFGAPEPTRKANTLRQETNAVRRAQMASPDFMDETLGFGEFVLGLGRSFVSNATNNNSVSPQGALVGKKFTNIDGRTFLLETVEYNSIQSELQSLPVCQPQAQSSGTSAQVKKVKSEEGYAAIPKLPKAGANIPRTNLASHPDAQLAQLSTIATRGVVIDYPAYIGSGTYDAYSFTKDLTYLIAGPVVFNGPVIFEGGAVVKYTLSSTSDIPASITLNNSFTLAGTNYAPVVFTATDDDSIGDSMNGVDWNYTGYNQAFQNGNYAYPALDIEGGSCGRLSNFRICYATLGINQGSPISSLTIAHAQMYDCLAGFAFYNANTGSMQIQFTLNNCLFANVNYPLSIGSYNYCSITHCTFDKVWQFDSGYENCFTIYNSIFANFYDDWSYYCVTGGLNGFYLSGTFGGNTRVATQSPFQSVEMGNYYLSSDAINTYGFVSAAWVEVDPTLVAEMANKTTQPPIELPAYLDLVGSLTLLPQAVRYSSPSLNGAEHIGFHYDALDYTVANCVVDGGALTVEPGTAIAVRNDLIDIPGFGQAVNQTGFWVTGGASFTSHGFPNAPIVYTTVSQVQETPNTVFASYLHFYGYEFDSVLFIPALSLDDQTQVGPTLDFRFSSFYLQAIDYQFWSGENADGGVFSDDSSMYLTLKDCNIHGGQISIGNPPNDGPVYPPGSIVWVDNLFDRVGFWLNPTWYWADQSMAIDLPFQAYNNLFYGGLAFQIFPQPTSAGNWVLKDNLFDQVNFVQLSSLPLDYDYNGYWPYTGYPYVGGEPSLTPTSGGTMSGEHDVILTAAPLYQTGPYGNFYLPNNTPLYGAGSRAAADAGLYHYTTRVDQTKEGSEPSGHQVNIGLHYIAANSSGLPKDTDGDGIPDYVENWHGDGAYASHTDSETDWQNQYTATGIFDPTSAIYDSIDLSGDGLTGVAKQILGITAFSVANPLQLPPQQSATGMVDIPVNISVQNGSISALQALINGQEATGCDIIHKSDGSWHLRMNTSLFPNGASIIQVKLLCGNDFDSWQSLNGPLCIAQINNPITVNPFSLIHMDTLQVETGLNVPADNYSINIYDADTNYLTTLSGTPINSGVKASWDLTDGNGHVIGAGPLQCALSISDHGSQAAPPQTFWSFQTKHISGNGFVVAANGGAQSAFINDGDIVTNMDNLLDKYEGFDVTDYDMLPSGYNLPYGGIPFLWYPQDNTSYTILTDALKGSGAANFYWLGHAGPDSISPSTNALPYSVISAEAVAAYFGNQGSAAPPLDPPPTLANNNPFRLVILDGCDSYSKTWSDAWGIPVFGETTEATFQAFGLDPNAFVGWDADIYKSRDTLSGQYYTVCLYLLFNNWQQGSTLKACLRSYNSGITSTTVNPPSNLRFIYCTKWKISGCSDLTTYDR